MAKETCGAHDLLSQTISRVQDMQQKISDEVAENNIRTATLDFQLKTLNENVSAFREENERYQTNQTERLDKLFSLFHTEKKKTQWRPIHLVTILTSLITAAGGIYIAIVGKGKIIP